jgi:hypothetical protein
VSGQKQASGASVGVSVPTEDNPEYGAYGSHGVCLSEAKRWVEEDGTHIVRSLEFDVWGEGDDWNEALADFGECFRAYLRHLIYLGAEEVATDGEQEQKAKAVARMAEVFLRHDRELDRRLDWPWRRSRRHDSDWHRPSKQGNSHLVSVG